MQGITIVGPGRVGGALGLSLSSKGYRIESIVYRTRRDATALAAKIKTAPELVAFDDVKFIRSAIILITVPDGEISVVVDSLAGKIDKASTIFHTSGSLSSEILDPFRRLGAAVASLHPLASVSTPESGVKRFEGAFFCVEGDRNAVRIGKRLVSKLGGRPFTIDPSAKPLYHAAAVTSSGHATALFDMALSLMTKAGLSRNMARRVLQPLLAGTVANLIEQDTPAALTGPFARVDVATFSRQIDALAASASPSEIGIYLDLAARSLDIAAKRSVDEAIITKMRRQISLAKRRLRVLKSS